MIDLVKTIDSRHILLSSMRVALESEDEQEFEDECPTFQFSWPNQTTLIILTSVFLLVTIFWVFSLVITVKVMKKQICYSVEPKIAPKKPKRSKSVWHELSDIPKTEENNEMMV